MPWKGKHAQGSKHDSITASFVVIVVAAVAAAVAVAVVNDDHDVRCEDEEKVRVVRVVAREIAKLTARLVECAAEMSQTFQVEEDGEEPPLVVREEAELLRREWSSQVSTRAINGSL